MSASCEARTIEVVGRPFRLTLGATNEQPTAGGAGGVGGEEDLGDSDCVRDGDTACQGLARVTMEPSGPTLHLADGSEFAWQLDDTGPGSLAEQRIVHVEYSEKQIVICPFCGTTTHTLLVITDAMNREEMYLYGEETDKGEIGIKFEELSGLTLKREPTCSAPSEADCYVETRTTYYDTILSGLEEQHVPYGKFAEVEASQGSLLFYAAPFKQTGTSDDNCSDGRGLSFGGTMLVIQQ